MAEVKTSWADQDDDLPSPQIIDNNDGTKTIISYKYNDDNKKTKVTQKVKEIKISERVHPAVAKRKKWAKFGVEKNSKPGPDFRTTHFGEPVYLNLGTEWKRIEKQEVEKQKEEAQQKPAKSNSITCRVCGGAHFTSKCPYKDQLGIDPESTAAAADLADATNGGVSSSSGVGGGSDANKSGYVPPHLRKKMGGMLGQEDADDKKEEVSSTLRFSQLNESIEEEDLRDLLRSFSAFINRVTVVRNRETGRSRGFAYVEFENPSVAQECLERFDGKGLRSLILRVEFSKQKRQY